MILPLLLSDYLGLVFEHYLKGVELHDRTGVVHRKQISIYVNENEVISLTRTNDFDSSIIHNVRGSIQTENDRLKLEVKCPFPSSNVRHPKEGSEYRGNQGGLRPVSHDDRIEEALAMRREVVELRVSGYPVPGVYLYRNMRLIEFGSSLEGIKTGGPNYTCGEWQYTVQLG